MTSPNPRTPASGPSDFYGDLREIIDDALSDSVDADVDTTTARIADAARAILHCGFVAVLVRDHDGGPDHLVVRGAREAHGEQATLTGLAARVIYDGVTVRSPDISLQAAPLGLPVEPGDVRELLAVPVRSNGRVVGGVFAARRNDGRPFRREAEHDARTLAAAIGFVVDHARVTATMARREQWLHASVELGRELVADAYANPLQTLVERIVGVAEADLVTVVVPAVDETKMVIASAAGRAAEEIEERVLERQGSVHDLVFDEHDPLIVDLTRTVAYRDELEALKLECALLVPLPALPGNGGVLTLYRGAGRPPFSRVETEMATTLGSQIELAMELAGNRADRERGALLAERDRIARDLHDNIIQQLFATGMALQSVAGELDTDAAERVVRAVDDLDQTIVQIRSTIYRLTTPTLGEGSGLRRQIDQVITRVEEILGFAVDLDVSGPIDLGIGDTVGQDVIAVLQETLTNVAKHAQASSARVSLGLRDDVVTLVVTDNGGGIGETTRRSGLANLRARAETLGGSMSTDSGPTGTQITWSVPAGS